MPERASVSSSGKASTTGSTVTSSTAASEYQITDDALQSLRSRRTTLGRTFSGDSHPSQGPLFASTTVADPSAAAVDGVVVDGLGDNNDNCHHDYGDNNNNNNINSGTTEDQPPLPSQHHQQQPHFIDNNSNRSNSQASLWSSILRNGRRIYGSAASIASSITLTEFAGEFSEEFNLEQSEHSLDIFAQQRTDSQPQIPQRHASVMASSSLLSTASGSDHNNGIAGHKHQPHRVSFSNRASDLSPKQPGRKTSLATHSDTTSELAARFADAGRISSLGGSGHESNSSLNDNPDESGNSPHSNHSASGSNTQQQQQQQHPSLFPRMMDGSGSSNSTASTRRTSNSSGRDCMPQHPSRKKSSKLLVLEDTVIEEDYSSEHRDVDFSGSSSSSSLPPTLEELTILIDNANVFRACLERATAIGHHEYGGISHRDSFVGAEAIDAILQYQRDVVDTIDNDHDHGEPAIQQKSNKICSCRQEALDFGLVLEQELGLFHHVANGSPFCDSATQVYKFAASPPHLQLCLQTGRYIPRPVTLMSVRCTTDTSVTIQEEMPLE